MTKQADKKLLRAVLEPRAQGALRQIADACAAGADPDAITPETSTASGYVRPGSTLLTHAVHDSSSKAVQKLLECGADPNLQDQNGWTPWMASTLVDGSKRDRIQESLLQYGAQKVGEHIGRLIRAIFDGDLEQASELIQSEQDIKVLSNFRVDLVDSQLASHNSPMLQFLLERNMTPTSSHLLNAVRTGNPEAVDLLLRFGVPPERPGDNETLLMTAAAIGDLTIVKKLVEAGADVNRSDPDNIEWTASFYAKKAGRTDVANWLAGQMSGKLVDEQNQRMEARNPKFRILYEKATSGEGLSTDGIVEVLGKWDEHYGIVVKAAGKDSVTIAFSTLPPDIDVLVEQIVAFCPDVCEDVSALQKELIESGILGLWWD